MSYTRFIRTRTDRAEPVFYPGSGLSFRVVRNIVEWDGRTVGVVRVGYGAEMIVQLNPSGSRWDILSGVSQSEVYGQ